MPTQNPIKPQWFHILLALAGGDLHGFAIQRAVLDQTNGALKLWPAMLYRSLATLVDEGLIRPIDDPSPGTPDERRRYYALTAAGRERLNAEAELMSAWVEAARSTDAP